MADGRHLENIKKLRYHTNGSTYCGEFVMKIHTNPMSFAGARQAGYMLGFATHFHFFRYLSVIFLCGSYFRVRYSLLTRR